MAAAFARVTLYGARRLVQHGVLARSVAPVTWILAVTDRAIEPVADALRPSLLVGDVVLHLAGMLGPDALSSLRAAGASVGAMHPLAAVASTSRRHPLRPLAFTFEGDPDALREVQRFCRKIKASVIVASSVDRARYHAAAALVATGGAALAQGAAALFAQAISPTPDETALRAAVASLLHSVAHNVALEGVAGALASPLLREDTDTVAKHLAAMERVPTARAMYRAALAEVLGPLEAGARVSPETIARARALLDAR